MIRTQVIALVAALAAGWVAAAEREVAMFGNTPSRNMVSAEKGLPTKFDAKSGLNVRWVAELGTQSYAGPVVAGGKVFVGSNNQRRYDPELDGDRGNLLAFDAATGKFLWQAAHPKLPQGRVNDWPMQGICSTPYIEGDRLYYVSNRAEVICADTEGFHDGENDGPYADESETLPGAGEQGPKKLAKTGLDDEDVVWRYDLIGELDVFPHNLAAGNPLVVGNILYTVTGQGVDEGHINVPSPLAPTFVALNKLTGELVWEDSSPGERIFHGSWSNPAYGEFAGKGQILIPGGNGWLYAFEPKTGAILWKFNLNPPGTKWILGGRGTANNVISTPVVHDGVVYVAVGQDPEHGEGPGNLWAIEPAGKSGDVTGQALWHVGGDAFHRTLSTAAVHDGLLYIADLSGFVYCFEARTGKLVWTYDALAAIWGSTFVADGKVYIGDEDGDLAVLRAGRELELLHEANLGAAVYTTPVAKDGTLYVVSNTRLFALKEGIAPKAPAPPAKPAPAAPEAGR